MKAWREFAAGAFAALLVMGSAHAQEAHRADHGQEPAGPLGDEPSPDEVIRFFTLFSADERMAAAIDPLVAELTRPGEIEKAWETGGIDILADFAAMEGGLGAFLLRDTDREVLSAIDLFAGAEPDISRFDSYALRPDPVGLVSERVFTGFFPGVWFETAHQREKRGNALCYSGHIGVTLHSEQPVGEWDQDRFVEVATMFALIDRLASLELCTVYDRGADGSYVSRTYLPGGARLEALDAETTPALPMPASALDAFLREVPEPAAEE
ncbi:MAG: hypothetical protein V2I39_11960 [Erythrobacter sp.]|jgi:hypothetical protein|nr:hypothetical protein [Erythrobacter sp.]